MKTQTHTPGPWKSYNFSAAVNWEYVASHHNRGRDGKVKPGPWCERIIAHARLKGYKGKITLAGACRIINAHIA